MRPLPATAVALLLLVLPSTASAQGAPCTGDPSDVRRLGARSYVAYPSSAPRAVVTIAHGYSFSARAWRSKLSTIARRDRAVAVAVATPGERLVAGQPLRTRGWPVARGALELATVTKALRRRCRTARRAVLVGFSMGGNIASVAAAGRDGRGVWDAFLGVEGIYDLEGTWRAGSALRDGNAFADQALDDIEAETGGTPDARKAAYDARNPVERAAAMARNGLKRAVLVHARDDGLALYSFAQEMTRRLSAGGLRTTLVTVGARGPDDEPDTSLSETLGQPRQGAGHVADTATKHVTVTTALRQLGRLVRGR